MESIELFEYLTLNLGLVEFAILGLVIFLIGLYVSAHKKESINRYGGRILDLGFSFTTGLILGLILFFDNDQTPSNFPIFESLDITLLVIIIGVSWNMLNLIGAFIFFTLKQKKPVRFILGEGGKMPKEK